MSVVSVWNVRGGITTTVRDCLPLTVGRIDTGRATA